MLSNVLLQLSCKVLSTYRLFSMQSVFYYLPSIGVVIVVLRRISHYIANETVFIEFKGAFRLLTKLILQVGERWSL